MTQRPRPSLAARLLRPQGFLATTFLGLGSLALFAPRFCLDMGFTPRALAPGVSQATELVTAFFGSQACLCGLLFATVKMTRTGYLVFGLAMVPYFIMDYYYLFVNHAFTPVWWLDVVGNITIAASCWIGYQSESDGGDSEQGGSHGGSQHGIRPKME
ncbi:hypothetical protein HK105_206372 [Polyrhizophydium stewartii]|uniref:Uncharacterized protein n=1 Tax=Polyrhizophydium stewartii TaxID=2732419 RepID=A0ABR4N3Q3_9FUNG